MKRNQIIHRLNNAITIMAFLLIPSCSGFIENTQQTAPPANLKVTVLPILDALPMHLAEKEGLFEKYGVDVELIPVASAPERDQIISSGQADGMINEVISTMLYNKENPRVQIVRYARAATPEVALFSIIASKNSDIENPEDLKGVPIGISEGTVIDYLTDRLLQKEGLLPDEISTIAVPKISDRMALLETGELEAAMLPEPMSSLASQQGGKLIIDDTSYPEFSFSTISFRKEIIDEHPEAVKAFLSAIEEAVQMINKDPQKYAALLTELNLIPPPLAGTFPVPPFVTAGVPTPNQWDDVMEWAIDNGFMESAIPYEESVNPDLLP